MVYTLDEIARRIRPVAEKYKLKAVYVFGSYARGEAQADSDVDILVDTTGSGLFGLAYGRLYGDLKDALEKDIDMVTVSALELPIRHENDADFREVVQRERREVYAAA